MLRFGRKICQSCGSECLESDPRCWACGGWSFQPDANTAAPDSPKEPTLVVDQVPSDVTMAWRRRRPAPLWWWTAAGVGATVVLAGWVGFWLGRSSAAPAPVQVTTPPKAYTTQVLPPPPSSLHTAPPIVEIRPLPGQTAYPVVRQPAPPRVATSALPGYVPPPENPNPAPPAIPAPAPGPPRVAPHVAAAAAGKPPSPALDAKTSLVALRNDAGVPLELHFDGFNGAPDEMISVAPGAAFDVPMTAGDYRLRAASPGAAGDNSRIVLAGRQRYSLVVGATGTGGGIALKIHEPAVDGGRP